jgi:hypothetical protein
LFKVGLITDAIHVLPGMVIMHTACKEQAVTTCATVYRIIGGDHPSVQILKKQCSTLSSKVGLVSGDIIVLVSMVALCKT